MSVHFDQVQMANEYLRKEIKRRQAPIDGEEAFIPGAAEEVYHMCTALGILESLMWVKVSSRPEGSLEGPYLGATEYGEYHTVQWDPQDGWAAEVGGIRIPWTPEFVTQYPTPPGEGFYYKEEENE